MRPIVMPEENFTVRYEPYSEEDLNTKLVDGIAGVYFIGNVHIGFRGADGAFRGLNEEGIACYIYTDYGQ